MIKCFGIKSAKAQIIFVLLLLSVLGIMHGGYVGYEMYVGKVAILTFSVLASICTELVFGGKISKQKLQSAAVTGLIIGAITIPIGSYMFALSASLLAIGSKRVIKDGAQHAFNPAAFGLISASLIFSNQINWWGGVSPVVIIIAAGLILLRLKKLAMPFAYFGTRVLLAVIIGIPLTTALLLPNLFFAFVMLIEPKTSPVKQIEQWFFGAICGVLSVLLYRYTEGFDADLVALLIMNLLFFIYRKRKVDFTKINTDFYSL